MRKLIILGVIFLTTAVLALVAYSYYRARPHRVQVSNVTARSATISWVTKLPAPGMVTVSKGSGGFPFSLTSLGKDIYYDDRDVSAAELEAAAETRERVSNSGDVSADEIVTEIEVNEMGDYFVHHVTVTNLDPETEYSFKVGSGLVFFKATTVDGDDAFITYTELESVPAPDPSYGKVLEIGVGDLRVLDGVVYLRTIDEAAEKESTLLSSALNEDGAWYIDLSNGRLVGDESKVMLQTYEGPSETILHEVVVEAGTLGRYNRSFGIDADAPAADIVIGNDTINGYEGNTVNDVTLSQSVLVEQVHASPCYGTWIKTCDNGATHCENRGSVQSAFVSSAGGNAGDGRAKWEGEACNVATDTNNCGEPDGGTCGGGPGVSPTPAPQQSGSSPGTSGNTTPSGGSLCGPNGVNKNAGDKCLGIGGGSVSGAYCPGLPGEVAGCDAGGPLGCLKCDDDGQYYCANTLTGQTGCQARDGIGSPPGEEGNGSPNGNYDGPLCSNTSGTCVNKIPNTEFCNPQTNTNFVCRTDSGATTACRAFDQGTTCNPQTTVSQANPSLCSETGARNNATCPGDSNKECYIKSDGSKECRPKINTPSSTAGASGEVVTVSGVQQDQSCTTDGALSSPAGLICHNGKWMPYISSGICGNLSGCYCQSGNPRHVLQQGEECLTTAPFIGPRLPSNYCIESGSTTPVDSSGKSINEIDGQRRNCCSGVPVYYNAPLDKYVCGASTATSCPADCDPNLPANQTNSCYYNETDSSGNITNSYYCDSNASSAKWSCFQDHLSEDTACPANCGECVCGTHTKKGSVLFGSKRVESGESCGKLDQNIVTARQAAGNPVIDGNDDANCNGNVGKECFVGDPDSSTVEINTCKKFCELQDRSDLDSDCKVADDGSGPIEVYKCEDDRAPVGYKERASLFSVFAQNSNEILLDIENNTIVVEESGKYIVKVGEEYYSFNIYSADEATLLYIDQNNNRYYDNEDKLVTENLTQLSLSKVSSYWTYSLTQGFNFISFPGVLNIDESGVDAGTFLEYLNSEYSDILYSISYFDSGRWKVINANNNESYGANNFQIVPGQGYLLHAKRDVKVVLSGSSVESEVPLLLNPGWNLVSIHGSNTDYTAESWIDSIDEVEGLDADNVTRWDTGKARYEGLQKEPDNKGVQQVYGFDFPIFTDNGYFVRIKEGEGRWTPE